MKVIQRKKVEVVAVSDNNGYLVSDGRHCAWIMQRQIHDDNTISPTAEMELAASKDTVADMVIARMRRKADKEIRDFTERTKFELEGKIRKLMIGCRIPLDESHTVVKAEKAWKFWLGRTDLSAYKKDTVVRCYEYLPVSQVILTKHDDHCDIILPRWLFNECGWLSDYTDDEVTTSYFIEHRDEYEFYEPKQQKEATPPTSQESSSRSCLYPYPLSLHRRQ